MYGLGLVYVGRAKNAALRLACEIDIMNDDGAKKFYFLFAKKTQFIPVLLILCDDVLDILASKNNSSLGEAFSFF